MKKTERPTTETSRPPFLSALCILTFIGSLVGFAGYFLASIFFERFSEAIISYSSWDSTESISPLYFTLLMVLYALSLTGAIRMWKLHRDGFYLYIFSQFSLLLAPVIWVNWNAFSYTNAIFIIVFSVGYCMNLKHMKQ